MSNTQHYAKGAIVLLPDVPLEHVREAIKYNFSAQQAYFKFSCNEACKGNYHFIPVLEQLLTNTAFLVRLPFEVKETYVQEACNHNCQTLIKTFEKHPDFATLCTEIERVPTPEPEHPRLPPILKPRSFKNGTGKDTQPLNDTVTKRVSFAL